MKNLKKNEDDGLMKLFPGTQNVRPSLADWNEEILKETREILASAFSLLS